MKRKFRIHDPLADLSDANSIRKLLEGCDIAQVLGTDLRSVVEQTGLNAGLPDYIAQEEARIRELASGMDLRDELYRASNVLASSALPAMDEEHQRMSAMVKGSVQSAASAFELLKASNAYTAGVYSLEAFSASMRDMYVGQQQKLSAVMDDWNASASLTQKLIDLANGYGARHQSALDVGAGIVGMKDALSAADAVRNAMGRTAAGLFQGDATLKALSAGLVSEFDRLSQDQLRTSEVFDAARYAVEAFAAYETLNSKSLGSDSAAHAREPMLPATKGAAHLGRMLFVFLQAIVLGEVFSGGDESAERKTARIAYFLGLLIEIYTGQNPRIAAHNQLFPEPAALTKQSAAADQARTCENVDVAVVRRNARLRENPESKGRILTTLPRGTLIYVKRGSEVSIGEATWIRVEVRASDNNPAADGWVARRLIEPYTIASNCAQQ